MISGRNGVWACAHLVREYYLTGHHVGGEIFLLLSQIHRMVDAVWTSFIPPMAQGSATLPAIPDILNGSLVGVLRFLQGWHVLLSISQVV